MKCEKCGGTEFDFLESYQKAVNPLIPLLGSLAVIILAAIFIASQNQSLMVVGGLLVGLWAVALVVMKIMNKVLAHKTRTKAVCKNCGHTFIVK